MTPRTARRLARFLQTLAALVLRLPIRLTFRARVRMARLPPPPVVLAANHRSYADPPFVGMWLREPIAYFARANLWDSAFIRFMLEVMQGIPVQRDNPGVSSMKGAVDRLRQGVSVLAFPEGTRTRDGRLGGLREGPALFARRAGVPVVPIYIHRSERLWPRGAILPRLCGGRVEIRFGRAIVPPAGLEPRLADRVVTEALRRWMERQERALLGPRRASAVRLAAPSREG